MDCTAKKLGEPTGIKAIDGERAACREAVGNADVAFSEGRLEDTLNALGEADGLMEKLLTTNLNVIA